MICSLVISWRGDVMENQYWCKEGLGTVWPFVPMVEKMLEHSFEMTPKES